MRLLQWLIDLFSRIRGPVPPPNRVSPSPKLDAATKAAVVEAINDVRIANGRRSCSRDDELDVIAQGWASSMAAKRNLSHGDFRNRVVDVHPGTPDGEVIASGQATPSGVVASWMRSPPHKEILLGDFDLVGVGFARGIDNMIYWCVDFDNLE